MRPVRLLPWLMLPLLAACGGGDKPAPASQQSDAPAISTEAQPSENAPTGNGAMQTVDAGTAAATPTALPPAARPILGTWASDLADCADGASQIIVTPAKFESADRSCAMVLADNGDGTFALTCGQEKIKMTPVYTPTGEGITLAFGDGSKQTVLRCSQ